MVGVEKNLSSDTSYYAFDPQSILQSLKEGRKDVFSLIEKAPPSSFSVNGVVSAPPWVTSDYFFISSEFHKTVKDSDLSEWKLKRISEGRSCGNFEKDYQIVAFTYFKWVIDPPGAPYRLERRIYIDPMTEYIDFSEDAWEAPGVTEEMIDEWDYIDFSSIKVSAEEALEIGEEKGGKEYYKAYPDDCRVIYDYWTEGKVKDSWRVIYLNFGSDKDADLDIYINVFSGETKFEPEQK